MYDVIFIDGHGIETVIAASLVDRHAACQLAREFAAQRGVGRMMLPGSNKQPNCVCVIPSSQIRAAA